VHAYGRPGQAQGGIDILVRVSGGGYEVWQAKRRRQMAPAQVRTAIELFLSHEWKSKAKRLILAVACNLDSTGNVKAIEQAGARLAQEKVTFEPFDAAQLSSRLITEPEIVDDFFGRPWVEALCPPEAMGRLARRLSPGDTRELRIALREWFGAWVSSVDPGLPVAQLTRDGLAPPSIPIVDRYVQPDFVVRAVEAPASLAGPRNDQVSEIGDPEIEAVEGSRRPQIAAVERERRIDANLFLSGKRQVLISAGAGMGKSTLLRVVALDMLSDSSKLSAFGDLKGYIPIWVPFALWTRMAGDRGAPPPLEDVIREFYRAQSEAELGEMVVKALATSRIILLVDGLDESNDATAATTVAAVLATFTETRSLSALVTTRPHGLHGTTAFGGTWTRAELAPLSDAQRYALSKLWFRVMSGLENGAYDSSKLDVQAEARARSLDDALRRSPGVARLSRTPLFLLALMQLHRQQQDLPRSRFAAIEKIIEELSEHQPRRRQVEALTSRNLVDLKPIQRDRLLEHFAYELHSGALDGPVTDAATVSSAIANAAGFLFRRQGSGDVDSADETARAVLAFAEERAGLLVKKAPGAVGFLHLSIQEFLTARHLLQSPFPERVAFISENAEKPRWREPILYLLYLERNEGQVGQLIEAIAEARTSSAMGRHRCDALLADALFSNFSHDISIATEHARHLLDQVEVNGWGERERHILLGAVDGMASEALGGICSDRVASWVPDRHGYGRAGAFRMMPSWPPSTLADCRDILLRALRADEEPVQRTAGEVLALIAEPHDRTKNDIVALLKGAPSVGSMAMALYALGCGWAGDDDVGRLAAMARDSADPRIALEAIRVRAKRQDTDDSDFQRFFQLTYGDRRSLRRPGERGLVEHFASTHRETFTVRLTDAIEDSWHRNPHDLFPLIGALLTCEPNHPRIEPGIRDLLQHDWMMRQIFVEGSFPADAIPWTPSLDAEVERFVDRDKGFDHYELYWIAKARPLTAVKAKILRSVEGSGYFRFWTSKALVEVWGAGDPEVRNTLLPFLHRPGEEVAAVSEALAAVCDDKDECRIALLRALRSTTQDVVHPLEGLRALGVPLDDEIFAASMDALARLRAPIHQDQWREQMLLTFPHRREVRRIALEELHRRNGEIAAVAKSYATDLEIITELQRVLAPMPAGERLLLAKALQGLATNDDGAARILQELGEDTEAAVAAEGVIGTAEILFARGSVTESYVEGLTDALATVGPDYESRRAAAVCALAEVGRLDRFAVATERGDVMLQVSPIDLLERQDRYLRYLVRNWPDFSNALGGDDAVVDRLKLTRETVLPLLTREEPYADHLFDVLQKTVGSTRHPDSHVLISSLASFRPRSAELRAAVREQLLTTDHYWGGLVAGEVFAEQFFDDTALTAEVVEAFTLSPEGFSTAAALAELVLRKPNNEIRELLYAKVASNSYDVATHFKLLSALSSPGRVIGGLKQLLNSLPSNLHDLQLLRWVPTMVKRIEGDADLQEELRRAIAEDASPSERASFTALLSRAGALDTSTTTQIDTWITSELASPLPEVGFDVVAQQFRVVNHVLVEALM
jgi:hypothetical protein